MYLCDILCTKSILILFNDQLVALTYCQRPCTVLLKSTCNAGGGGDAKRFYLSGDKDLYPTSNSEKTE